MAGVLHAYVVNATPRAARCLLLTGPKVRVMQAKCPIDARAERLNTFECFWLKFKT